jgi:hypothetical protein
VEASDEIETLRAQLAGVTRERNDAREWGVQREFELSAKLASVTQERDDYFARLEAYSHTAKSLYDAEQERDDYLVRLEAAVERGWVWKNNWMSVCLEAKAFRLALEEILAKCSNASEMFDWSRSEAISVAGGAFNIANAALAQFPKEPE